MLPLHDARTIGYLKDWTCVFDRILHDKIQYNNGLYTHCLDGWVPVAAWST